MSEYVGSRLSLISKSDIRYVGTLHEINSDNHTVALENVTSHGTEGRKGKEDEEIPGSDIVYEYIVFRGSDVKNLDIVSGPGVKENQPPKVPDDPAILGSARPAPQSQPPLQQPPPDQNQFRGPQPPYPPQQQFGYPGPPNQFPGQPRFPGPGGPHGFPGTPGAAPGYGQGFGPPPPGYGMGYGPPPGHGFPPQPPPGHFNHNQQMPIGPPGQQMNQHRPSPQMHGQQQPPVNSKQGTPQPGPQGPPPQTQGRAVEMSATPGPSEASSGPPPPPPVDSKPPVSAATAPSAATQAQQQGAKPPRKTNSRVAVPLPNPNVLAAKPPQKPTATAAAATVAPPGQPQSVEDATQAATAAVAAAMAKLGNQSQAKPTADGTDNLTQKLNQMRLQDGQNQRGRGRGRGGPPRGGRRDSTQKAIEVPKEDFDFESSNAKFNKDDLAKEAHPGSPLASPNGDKADPLAATNGHVNGATDDEVVIPASDPKYNKQSSFFDDISSDLKDRIEQAKDDGSHVDGRALRAQERSKNMDTFGQGSVDGGYRGGYRGRGRGRGYVNNYRGRGDGNYRGGRGNYEYRGNGYRGRGGRGGQESTVV